MNWGPKTLLSTSAAVSTEVVELDYRYGDDWVMPYQGTLTAGDSITLKASIDGTIWETEVRTSAVFSGSVQGPVRYFKAYKTGTAGLGQLVIMAPGHKG